MSSVPQRSSPSSPDLSVCESEPIHIPGSVEPNGVLLVIQEPGFTIVQASANAAGLLNVPEIVPPMPLANVLEHASVDALKLQISSKDLNGKPRYLSDIRVPGSSAEFDGLIHRFQGLLILELEPAESKRDELSRPGLHESLTDALADLGGPLALNELCQRVVAHISHLTGFDRVMLYRFLEDDSGCVMAEERRGDLISYLGLRYPASDIPPQARRLYVLNTLRLKPDVNAPPVPLVPAVNPITGLPLDMSHCVLRAMSPVHVEYLRNMGVSASMSISILKEERLWGLIACHHTEARTVPHRIRMSCEVLARMFSAYLPAAEAEVGRNRSRALRLLRERIQQRLRERPEVRSALAEEDGFTSLMNAEGAAICLDDEIVLVGVTPPLDSVQRVVEWLTIHQNAHVLSTEKLSLQYPEGDECAETASGLLSARIASGGSDFVLWFRPAVVQVVEWAGNPAKPVEESEAGKRISPRLSFERWKETTRDRSEPWQDHEREFAAGLRQDIAEALLVKKNKEVTYLNVELQRSNIELGAFAYSAGHDLQEPVRTIHAFAQLLARHLGTELDRQGKELLKLIEQGAGRMSALISSLLTYGQIGGAAQLVRKPVSLDEVLGWALQNVGSLVRETGAVVTHDTLPTVLANPDQMTEVLQNLIVNAIKYRKPGEAPRVHLSALLQEGLWDVSVSDNGQGFPPDKAELIFDAFKRLEQTGISGTGLGLAICRRIVKHHGGSIRAESEGQGQGATFRISLPSL